MRKLRYYIKVTLAFIYHFRMILLIATLAGILLFLSSAFLRANILSKSATKIGVPGRYVAENLPLFVLSDISYGLTRYDSEGIVVPSAAISWETPDKGRTWIFNLDTEMVWHDGTKLTSYDINYELSDVEIERPDDETIIFKLKEIYTPFPAVLSAPIFKKGFVGLGDWKVDRININSGIVLAIRLENGNEVVEYKFYPTEEDVLLAFKLGEIDKTFNIYDPKDLVDWNTVHVASRPDENKIVTLFYNTKDPVLSDKTLRQALSYAIQKTGNGMTRSVSSIPAYSWAHNPRVKTYDYDQEYAKEMMSNITRGDEELQIMLHTSPGLLFKAEQIASDWTDVGVRTSVQVTSSVPDDYQAYLSILDVSHDPDQYPMWHSTRSFTNITNYSSPRIDKLLEDGRLEIDLERRRNIYLDFQRFLLEDVPAIFLYVSNTYEISKL